MKQIFDQSVLASHTAVLGMTGSGKTSTAKLLIEQVSKDARVCILDPLKSDWWGITLSRDGKHAGLPFDILGGPHGHVPLHSGAGKAIGELVAKGSLRLSILDMANFEPGGVSRFFNDFSAAVWKHTRGLLYLLWEEAHEFAPKERSGIGAENMSVYYAKKFATGARSKGVRLVVCTQRVQNLHNAVLGSCQTVIVHRFIAPADQEPVLGWVKGAIKDKAQVAAIADSLSDLNDGEAYQIHGKDVERRQFPRIHTFDNSATPISDDDVHIVQAKVDTTQLRKLIGAAVQEAEANDPANLKAEIARLKKLDGKTFTSEPSVAQVDRWRHEGWTQGYEQGKQSGFKAGHQHAMEQIAGWHRNNDTRIFQLLANILEDTQDVRKLMESPTAADVERLSLPPAEEFKHQEVRVNTSIPVQTLQKDNLIGKRRAMLTALAQFGDMGARRMGILIDMSVGTGTWKNYIRDLRTAGYLEGDSNKFSITNAGYAALGSYEPLPSGADLQKYWLSRLVGKRRNMFAAILKSHRISADDLAREVEMSVGTGTWKNYVRDLRTLGLIVGSNAELSPSPELFQ